MGIFDLFRRKDQDDVTRELEQLKQRRGEQRVDPANTDAGSNDFNNGAGRLVVEDVFSITGRGTVVTGEVTSGTLTVGDQVEILRANRETIRVTIAGIEAFRKVKHSARAGDNVGLLLRGIGKGDVNQHDIISKV